MKLTTTLILASLFAAAGANAAVIADFDFDTDASSSDTELNSTAVFAPIPNATNVGRSSQGNAFIRTLGTGTDLAAALADTDVFTITITADPGFEFNLTSVNFDFGGQSSTAAAYTVNGVVTSGGTLLHNEGLTTSGTGLHMDTGNSESLAAAQFQGVTSATFTFANFDTTDFEGKTNRWDNISIVGDVVAVPEPSSTALLGLGGLALILRRRK